MEFISLRELFPGFSTEDIRIGVSQPRNKKLAEAFLRLRLIESYGTGIHRSFKLYENYPVQTTIQLCSDGRIVDLKGNVELNPDSVVSMNFWGFMPSIFPAMKEYFDSFLKNISESDIKAECLLPIMVDDMMREGSLEVSVLQSEDKWFGMTYKADKEIVSESLKKLHNIGGYPKDLKKIKCDS